MTDKRVAYLKSGEQLFSHLNTLIGGFYKHYSLGTLGADNVKALSNAFSKTVTRSPREILYMVRCLREETQAYIDDQDEEAWREVVELAEEVTIYALRVQYFSEALQIEAERATKSIVSRMEFRKMQSSMSNDVILQFHEWCEGIVDISEEMW